LTATEAELEAMSMRELLDELVRAAHEKAWDEGERFGESRRGYNSNLRDMNPYRRKA
jgi:hypothetical protein